MIKTRNLDVQELMHLRVRTGELDGHFVYGLRIRFGIAIHDGTEIYNQSVSWQTRRTPSQVYALGKEQVSTLRTP